MERFDAFISYSHAADGRLAPAVQTGLQRLAKKVFQRRALRVFRDETGLSTNPHLWGSIETAIDASDWFVLLASPESATSEWVNREVITWLERKPLDHILIVVTDGTITFRPDAGVDASTDSATNCLPQPLVDALDQEPRWLDLRWARNDTQLDLRNGRFRAAIADLAAPIHGLAKDDLESDDVHQQQRAKRLAIGGITAVALLAIASLIGALVAVDQRQNADTQRQRATELAERADSAAADAVAQAERADSAAADALAQAERADSEANRANAKGLAAQAVATSSSDLDLSLLLAVEGYTRDPSLDSQAGLMSALNASRLVTSLTPSLPDDVIDLEAGADQTVLYVLTVSGDLWAYDSATVTPIGDRLATGVVEPLGLAISRDGSRLAVAGGEGVGVIDTATGQTVAERLGEGFAVAALSPDGSMIALGLSDRVIVLDVDTGATLYESDETNASLGFLSDTRLAIQGLGVNRLTVYTLGTDGQLTVDAQNDTMPQGGGLEVSPDGSVFIAGGLRATAILVDSATLEFIGPQNKVRGSRTGDFAFSSDGAFVQLGSDDGSVLIVETGSGLPVLSLEGLTGSIVTEFVGDDELVSASASDGGAVTWALNARGSSIMSSQQTYSEGLQLRTIDAGQTIVSTAVGDVFVAPHDDVDHPSVRRTVGDFIRAIDVAEQAGLVALYVQDFPDEQSVIRSFHIVGLDDLQDETVIEVDSAIENISLSPDGSMLAVGTRDGALQIFDVASGELLVDLPEVDDVPCCLGTLVWSLDGQRLHTGGQDGVLRTFDTTTWTLTAEQQLTTGQIALRLSQLDDAGSTIIVPTESGEIFLVDEATGVPIGEPFISAGTQIQRAVLVLDGTVLAAQSRDGKLRLWDVATHRLIGRPLDGHFDTSASVERIAQDVVVTGGAADGQIIEWSLDPDVWVQRACALAGRNLTRDEWDAYVGSDDYQVTCDEWPAAP